MPRTKKNKLSSGLEEQLNVVLANRCLLLCLSREEHGALVERHYSGRGFTIAVPNESVKEVRTPALCLIFGGAFVRIDGEEDWSDGYIGVLTRKRPTTAVQRELKIEHTLPIESGDLNALVGRMKNPRSARSLRSRLSEHATANSLPSQMGRDLMCALTESSADGFLISRLVPFFQPKDIRPVARQLQSDAIKSALEIFGLPDDAHASSHDLLAAEDTELSRVWLREDPVITRDGHHFPGLQLKQIRVTGRATFRRGSEVLEVITANRSPLEKIFGVDLIYHNMRRNSLVMIQYKMLDPASRKRDGSQDWIYRVDEDLVKELARMKRLMRPLAATSPEYRLNSEMFYIKFVRRDKIASSAAITIPLQHYEMIQRNPQHRGPKGGLRVSYRALNGAYLRNVALFNLIRSGYIGAPSTTTKKLLPLIRALERNDRAIVIAVERALKEGEETA